MPWHASLMPIGPNYLAVERSVIECAYAGCDTIWIVCDRETTPLIRYQIGEAIQDPVYNYRKYEKNKTGHKRPIRIYYVPLNVRDINKRDNVVWSAIQGALTANKIIGKISPHLAPQKFWISWPYGFYHPSATREFRKQILNKDFMFSFEEQTAKDNLYLGMTLDISQAKQLLNESKTRSSGLWVDPGSRTQKYSEGDRFSYKNFNLSKVLETLNYSNYTIEAVHKYYCLDNWSAYCKFLSENQTLTRPKLLKALEWNEIGYDEE